MIPVEEIKNVVHSIFPDWQVYYYAIPAEVIDDKNVTQVLITESDSAPTTYADEIFHEIALGYDLQIFYGLEEGNLLVNEVKLYKALEENYWRITNSQPHYLDISQTDEQQMIKNIEINRTFTLDEITK